MLDRDGEKIGKLEGVYVDIETDAPTASDGFDRVANIAGGAIAREAITAPP
jgi:hypothetical protein